MAADVFDSRLYLCVLVVVSCSLAAGKSRPKLFKEDGDVFILNVTNFNRTVLDSDYFWMIKFYNSWCGHCMHFAPIWTDIATSIKNWDSVVRLAAVECSDTANLQLCRGYNIHGYPTLLSFPVDTSHDFLGHTYSGDMTPIALRQYILNSLSHANNPDQKPDRFSSLLQPLESLEYIWEHLSDSVQYVAVLFEDEGSNIGQELILDMYPYKELLLRRMLKKDVTKFGVKVFPSLYLIQKDGSFQNLVINGWDREHFRAVLRQLLDLSPDVTKPVSRPKPELLEALEDGAGDGSRQIANEFPEGVYMDDLLSAVSHSLMHEVASIKVIDGQILRALKDYILVLYKYLPIPYEHKKFLSTVKTWLDKAQSPLEGSTWLRKLQEFQKSTSYIPLETNYTGCRGSEPRFRGYPCSMWVLFHTLSVNSVLEHSTEVTFDPQEVPLAMRGYITHFFGCRECSVNFNKGAKRMEDDIHQPDDGILFLWKSHNRANFHLHGDATEDPKHSKIQFPSKTMCPECYFEGKVSDDGKPNWDESLVLNFLKNFYSRQNIHKMSLSSGKPKGVDLKMEVNNSLDGGREISVIDQWRKNDVKRKEDLSKLMEIRAEQSQSIGELFDNREPRYNKDRIEKMKRVELDTRIGGNAFMKNEFTRVDLSLCVVFYFMCTICILVVYYHFIVRRGMKPRMCCQDLV